MSDIRYLKIEQIVGSDRYPFTMDQMRYLLIHRRKNGLNEAVRKIGKRIYIRMDLFDAWIEKQIG